MNLIVKTFAELTTEELYKILKIRSEVFVLEQQSACLDPDGKDLFAVHAYFEENGEILAYLRVLDRGIHFDEVSLGRILTVHRGKGLGAAIVKEGIRVAEERFGAQKIKICAQTHVRGFYEKAGFRQISDILFDHGIEHIYMIREKQ